MVNANMIEREDIHAFLFKHSPFKYNDYSLEETKNEELVIGTAVRECMRRGCKISFRPNGEFFECIVEGDDAAMAAALEEAGYIIKGTTKILGTDRGSHDSMNFQWDITF